MQDERRLLETLSKDAFNAMALNNFTSTELKALQQSSSVMNERIKRFETWRYLFAKRFPDDYRDVMDNKSKYEALVEQRQVDVASGDFWKKIYEAKLRFGILAFLEPNVERRIALDVPSEPHFVGVDSSGRYALVIEVGYLVYFDLLTQQQISRFHAPGYLRPDTSVAADSLTAITIGFGGWWIYDPVRGEREFNVQTNFEQWKIALNRGGDRLVAISRDRIALHSVDSENASAKLLMDKKLTTRFSESEFVDAYFVGSNQFLIVQNYGIRYYDLEIELEKPLRVDLSGSQKIIGASMSVDNQLLWITIETSQTGGKEMRLYRYTKEPTYNPNIETGYLTEKQRLVAPENTKRLPQYHKPWLPLIIPRTNKMVWKEPGGKYSIRTAPWSRTFPRTVTISPTAPVIYWAEPNPVTTLYELVGKSFPSRNVLVSRCIQCQAEPAQYTSRTKGGKYCSVGCYLDYHS